MTGREWLYRVAWWLRDGRLRVRRTRDRNVAEWLVETLVRRGVAVAHVTRSSPGPHRRGRKDPRGGEPCPN